MTALLAACGGGGDSADVATVETGSRVAAGPREGTPKPGESGKIDKGSVLECTRYTFVDLGTLGGTNSGATGINDHDEVVGHSDIAGDSVSHATLWRQHRAIDLDPLDTSSNSGASDINNKGEIVGSYAGRPALWRHQRLIELGNFQGYGTAATGINDDGTIVGSYFVSGTQGPRPIVWRGDTVTELTVAGGQWIGGFTTDINDEGLIAGASTSRYSDGHQATSWTGAAATVLPSGGDSIAYAVNDKGQFAGVSGFHPGFWGSATVWNEGTPTLLAGLAADDQGRFAGDALDINNSAQVVGWSSATFSPTTCCDAHAVLWDRSATPTDLNTLLDTSTANAGWVLVSAGGINEHGSIVGSARNALTGQAHAFLLSAQAVHHRFGAVGPSTLCHPSH